MNEPKHPLLPVRLFFGLVIGCLLLAMCAGCEDREAMAAARRACADKQGIYATVQGARGWTEPGYYHNGTVLFRPENMQGSKYGFTIRVRCTDVHPVMPAGVE